MGDRYGLSIQKMLSNLGRFIKTGKFSPQRTVAITGNAVEHPKYIVTKQGAELQPILNEFQIALPSKSSD